MTDAPKLRQERKKLFENAVRRIEKPKSVPLISHAWTWKVIDAGYTFSEGLLNYDNLFKISCEHHEKYNFDSYMEIGTAFLMRVTKAFGQCDYLIDDERGCLSYIDTAYLQMSDYDTLLEKGYEKFFWENLIPAKFHYDSLETAKEKIREGVREQQIYAAHVQRTVKQFNDVFGVPLIAIGRYMCPAEAIFWGLQGIKGMSIAMRKQPEKLAAVLEELRPFVNAGFFAAIENQASTDRAVFDYRMNLLAHNIMNDKQFEKFYWPYLKEYIDKIVEYDKLGFIFIQGTADRIMDYLQEIPKGHFAVMFENTDIFEAKKKLKDKVAITGGYPCRLLNDGTKQECIDFSTKIMNEIGYDGSYIFCADKMLGFKNDANPVNMKLVNDFFRSYEI